MARVRKVRGNDAGERARKDDGDEVWTDWEGKDNDEDREVKGL